MSRFLSVGLSPVAAGSDSVGGELPTLNLLENDRISIFAEKPGQRHYAERFAETIYEAAYETTGESAGKGLVIIGSYDEIHPILLIRKYADILQKSGNQADKAILGLVPDTAFIRWEEADKELKVEVGIDIESIAYVVPLPMKPAMLNLYFIAKEEGFDGEKIDQRYRTLNPLELRFADYERFDWVIYLPPRNAIDKAIKEVLPKVMQKQKVGFFKRTLVKGAVFTLKPAIRDGMEGIRKSLLYESILKATSDLSEGDIKALAKAYRESLMPRGKIIPRNKEDRSLEAIREQLKVNEAYAKDPFIPPEQTIEEDPEKAAKYVGEYRYESGRSVNIFQKEDLLYFQNKDDDPVEISPVSEVLYTTEDRKMTVEFLPGSDESYREAELRKERWRKTIRKK